MLHHTISCHFAGYDFGECRITLIEYTAYLIGDGIFHPDGLLQLWEAHFVLVSQPDVQFDHLVVVFQLI